MDYKSRAIELNELFLQILMILRLCISQQLLFQATTGKLLTSLYRYLKSLKYFWTNSADSNTSDCDNPLLTFLDVKVNNQ
jgi:hypothetical protein